LRIALLVALGFLRKDVEQFEHRKRYATLTPQVLATVPDDQLELAILDWIDSKIAGDYQHAHAIVARLSPGMRMLYATWWLESEVDNGGFNEFFWNSSGQFAQDALDGFKLLHADELANLTGAATRRLRARASGAVHDALTATGEGDSVVECRAP
jgi:hypothetical protein